MTITLTLTKNEIDFLYQTFKEFESKKPQYAIYQLKVENCTITAYESLKVVFQGKDAQVYASRFQASEDYFEVHAGSDEVGTGDYFGPVVVCACILTKPLEELKLDDSKSLSDAYIKQIAPKIMELIPYSLLILNNEKYNQIKKDNNLNEIKAKMHNQAYINLNKKHTLPNLCIIDQFAPKELYFRYLKNEPTIIKQLHFETKAESKYQAVAAASIIARYTFLHCWDKMEDHWNFKFHKGASTLVDEDIIRFVKQHGDQNLKHVAKLHFKNTDIIKRLDTCTDPQKLDQKI